MERHKRIAAASLAAVLLLAACSDGDPEASAGGIEAIEEPQAEPDEAETDPEPREDEAAPAVEPEPEPEPAPEPGATEIDITVVPDEITEEYVQAVLVELERLYSEAFSLYREADELTIDVSDRVGEAFTESQREARLKEFELFRQSSFEGFRSAPTVEPRDRSVVEVIQATSTCIYVETVLDFAGVLEDPPEPGPSFVLLVPQDLERPVDLNTSGWVFADLRTGDYEELREQVPC